MSSSKKNNSSGPQLISSDFLYHYTNSKVSLESILVNGFKPSYCKELIVGGKKLNFLAIPMVCFCDIPFELSEDHRQKYNSNYAIGLSKEWRIINRLNPIMYLNENSVLWEDISNIFSLIVEINNKKSTEIEEKLCDGTPYLYNSPPEVVKLKNILFSLVSMMKPYVGKRYDSNGKPLCEGYKFYDEREWRFVLESFPKYIISEHNNLNRIKKENPTSNNYLLFTTKDIRHIIVKNKSEEIRIKELFTSSKRIGGNMNNECDDINSISITSIN